MDVMTTSEAAKILSVTNEAVRKMLKSGRLRQFGVAGRVILIDLSSVHRARREGKRSGRLWNTQTAWAALNLISGNDVDWLSSSELWRLRKRLAELSAEDVIQLARKRATSRRFRGSKTAKQALAKVLALTGASILDDPLLANTFGLVAGGNGLEGYAKNGYIEENARRLGLREDPTGDILIREIDFVVADKEGGVPLAAIAVDLQDSHSTRERSAGLAILKGLLHA